jgi:hypothetical protein
MLSDVKKYREKTGMNQEFVIFRSFSTFFDYFPNFGYNL